jgi:hypothetical protein
VAPGVAKIARLATAGLGFDRKGVAQKALLGQASSGTRGGKELLAISY